MLSLAIANDMELHKIEMEQAFLQALLHHVSSSVDFQDLALQKDLMFRPNKSHFRAH